MTRRLMRGPAEGWLSLGLVMLLCVVMAWAIDDVAPVMGDVHLTDFLTWAAIGGVLAGFIGPQVGWGRWRTYLIGVAFAALLVPILVGGTLPQDGSIGGRFVATANAGVQAFYDLVVNSDSFTQEYGHHLWVLGLLVWATSMFASYAVFGHRHPLNAVVVVGVALVINMSLTFNDQLGYLVLYSVAALFLLIRSHALEEQGEWLRRRIGDPAAISGIYLRGGSVFIVLAIAGSLLLTQAARSDPLAGAWDDVSAGVIDMTRSIGKFLPAGPNARAFDAEFGEDTQIRGFWVGTDALDVTIHLPPSAPKGLYWRAVTYDRFDLIGWKSTQATGSVKSPGDILLADSLDEIPDGVTTETVTFTVTPAAYDGKYILSPLNPYTADQTVTRDTSGPGLAFAGLRRAPSKASYTVTAVLPVTDADEVGGLTANKLRSAGSDYPKEIRDLYLQPNPAGAVGPAAQALLAEMVSAMPQGPDTDPYDMAKTMETQFHRGDLFAYDTDVRDLACTTEKLSTSECFAKYRIGYCQYYATTMAVLLRELGVPVRIVDGYLPGAREDRTGIETLLALNRHEWVEVYFPGYGWVPFDPTGGGVAELPRIPEGPAVASPSPGASAIVGPPATRLPGEIDPGRPFEPSGPTSSGGGPSGGLLGAVAILLMLAVGSISFMVWRRGPRGATTPDGAYGSVTRLAARLGYGPRPNQTVYEYAGALGDVLPDARPALETVAQAKVESAYGQAVLGSDRIHALRDAERRLRVTLLRLLFRRGKRPF